jgi:hypothetical protein
MLRPSRIASLLLFNLLLLLPQMALADAPAVWLVGSLRHVPQDALPQANDSISISAARGETESFQIVVSAGATPITITDVVVADVVSASGASIPADNITRYRQHYVYVTNSREMLSWFVDLSEVSNMPLGEGWYPDALIPFSDPMSGQPLTGGTFQALPHTLPARQSQPFWVDVAVPRDATPGSYNARVIVRTDAGDVETSVSLVVRDFELPFFPTYGSSFQIWNVHTLAANIELMKHRMMPLGADAETARILRDEYGLTMLGLGYWSGINWQACQAGDPMPPPPTPDEVQARAAELPEGLRFYNQSFDEIDACLEQHRERIIEWNESLRVVNASQAITMTPTDSLFYTDSEGMTRSAIDLWVVLPLMYNEARPSVRAALERGEEVWSYAALMQDGYSPKWIIDFEPINHRLMQGFINQSLNLTGFMYWAVDYWTEDPWNNVNWAIESDFPLPSGDGFLFYPGDAVGLPDTLVPSLRAKWIRDGFEDYEYVQLLRESGQTDLALEIIRPVAPDWVNWTRDVPTLEEARILLAETIERTR